MKVSKSFGHLCHLYKEKTKEIEKIEAVLCDTSEILSKLSKKLKKFFEPEVSSRVLRHWKSVFGSFSEEGMDVVRVTRILDLRKKVYVYYHYKGPVNIYEDECVCPVGLGGFERDVISYLGEVWKEEPVSEEIVKLIKSIRRKINKLSRIKKRLKKRLNILIKERASVFREILRKIYGTSDIDEYEAWVAKRIMELASQTGVYDVKYLKKLAMED